MSLATRCFSCGTVFRVADDQLRISGGWVRCGRCENVFNARDGLFDLDRETPPPWHGGATTGSGAALPSGLGSLETMPAALEDEARLQVDDGPVETEIGDDPADTAARLHAAYFNASGQDAWRERASPAPMPGTITATGAGAFDERGARRTPDAAADAADPPVPAWARAGDDGVIEAASQAPVDEPTAEEARAMAAMAARHGATTPDFVRRAEQAAAWQRPGLRHAFGAGVALLALLLAVQTVLVWREQLAARGAGLRAAMQLLCALPGCRIEGLRRVESLVVDSSGLVKLDEANLYRLSLVLHNRDTAELLLPAVDLTLTDARGEVVARKVLRAGELGARQPAIAAGGEQALQGVLDPGDRRIAGYTVEIFYP